MLLTLSSGSPWDCNYSNESGQVLFKAAPPPDTLDFGENITISRVASPNKNASLADLEPVGEFHSNPFKTTRIVYMDDDQPVKQFFCKIKSISVKHRAFISPLDCREYVWKVYPKICQLFLNDASKTPVATFHCKRHGFSAPKRPASVEIFPPGEHMVELILVTLLYIEKLRQDIEFEEVVEEVAKVAVEMTTGIPVSALEALVEMDGGPRGGKEGIAN